MNIFGFAQNKKTSAAQMQSLFERIDLLLEAARTLFTQSEALKRVVASQKNSVQQSSSASHEISSMVSTTAGAAEELSRLAEQSNQAVESSTTTLESLVASISEVDRSSQELQASVKSGLREISSVTETMSEIREKAKMINEVVFQTKILSFNASVEAARAGEHGKGFAIVAEEMGNLARASGLAAQEIESILKSSVEKTQTQIDAVSKDLEKVAQQTVSAIASVAAKGSEISTAFTKLTEYSEATEAKAKEISTATSEQKVGVNEISKSLSDLESSSSELDEMAIAGSQRAADLSDSVEQITRQFSEIAKVLGYKLVKVEKPFDFNAAISAHIDWKMKLSKYLQNPDGTLDHNKVCLDNACALGKWIYGDGQSHQQSHSDLYSALKESHASFHRTAGDIIKLINSGHREQAEAMLGPSGPYLSVSEKTVSLIRKLKTVAEKREDK